MSQKTNFSVFVSTCLRYLKTYRGEKHIFALVAEAPKWNHNRRTFLEITKTEKNKINIAAALAR